MLKLQYELQIRFIKNEALIEIRVRDTKPCIKDIEDILHEYKNNVYVTINRRYSYLEDKENNV